MADLLPIRVREVQEAVRQLRKIVRQKIALDSEHNVVVIPDKQEPGIVTRLRDALIAEWRYAPQ